MRKNPHAVTPSKATNGASRYAHPRQPLTGTTRHTQKPQVKGGILNIIRISEPTPPSMDLTVPGVVEVTDPFNEQGAATEVLW